MIVYVLNAEMATFFNGLTALMDIQTVLIAVTYALNLAHVELDDGAVTTVDITFAKLVGLLHTTPFQSRCRV